MTATGYFSAGRRRWFAALCACLWLLYAVAVAFAPLPALAQSGLPPWAGDVCSQSHGAPQSPAPDPSTCPHALCCLPGCSAHHGPPLPSTALELPGAQTAQPLRRAQADPACLPGTRFLLLAAPRGPPPTST